MKESLHYTYEKVERQELIKQIGLGKVIHSCEQYDTKRGRMFRYEITDTAVLIVKNIENTYIITKMIARPSRIRKYWDNAPDEIIELAVKHHREKLYI